MKHKHRIDFRTWTSRNWNIYILSSEYGYDTEIINKYFSNDSLQIKQLYIKILMLLSNKKYINEVAGCIHEGILS